MTRKDREKWLRGRKVHGVMNNSPACRPDYGLAGGYAFTESSDLRTITCKKCRKAIEKMKCPKCKVKIHKVYVTSYVSQEANLVGKRIGDFCETNIGATVRVDCGRCNADITEFLKSKGVDI